MLLRRGICVCLYLLLGGNSIALSAEDKQPPSPAQEAPMKMPKPNVKAKTLGGVQFWGDVLFFHGWHIQRNVFTGHYRLLDASDVRHAWGTREECEAKLHEIRTRDKLPPMSGTAIIVLHGLARSDKSVSRMKRHLETAGFYTIAMNYPSTRASVPQNAEYLHEVLQSLHGIDKVHLVGFSMGGIVVRQSLSAHPEPRLGRVVLVGTPNQGAELATMMKDWWAFKTILGPSGQDLVAGPEGIAPQLPAPPCEFGIIAGCRGTNDGYNPLIPGDNDGTVSLESTRLAGARDFMVVRALHPAMMSTASVHRATEYFLRHGRFSPDRDPQPILSDNEKPGDAAVDAAADESPAKPAP